MFFDPAIVATLKLKEKTSEEGREPARGLVFKTRSSEKKIRRKQFTRQTQYTTVGDIFTTETRRHRKDKQKPFILSLCLCASVLHSLFLGSLSCTQLGKLIKES
jgi:hypothetical protein